MPPIHLKPDWDTPCSAPTLGRSAEMGHFVGRDAEIKRLSNELARSPQRSILFAGHRGVGKTTLVYAAFRKAEEMARPVTLVPVLLNANQLVATKDDQREVLVSLIRRLFRATADGALSDAAIAEEIARLYKRAVASQYKQSESQGRALERIAEHQRERTLELSAPKLAHTFATFAVPWAGAAALGLSNPMHGQLDTLAAVVLAGPVPLLAKASWRWSKSATTKTSATKQAEELYEFDASPGNLEFDLEHIHRKMGESEYRVVYIVDEVDKLSNDQALELFAAFKNLFTLSSAIFVFVSDAALYDHLVEVEAATFRPPSYTFFHSRYFIGRPRAADLAQFVDKVVEEQPAADDPLYADTKAALVFSSGGDFFDLVQRIRDRIDDFDELRPKITLRPLTAEQERAKQLGAAIQLVFEEKYYSPVPSEWRNNERLQAGLYEFTREMPSLASGAAVADPVTEDLAASATRDLNRLLERAGMLAATAATPTQIAGREVEVKTYNFVGTAPDGIPGTLDFLTEPEEAVVAAWDAFDVLARDVWSTYRAAGGAAEPEWDAAVTSVAKARLREWSLDVDAMRSSYEQNVRALRDVEPPPTHDRSTLEAWRTGLDSVMPTTLSALPAVVAHIVATLAGEAAAADQLMTASDFADTPLVAALRAQLSFPNAFAVSRPAESRQVLVVPVEAAERVQAIVAETVEAEEPFVIAVATTEEASSPDPRLTHFDVVRYVPRQPRLDDGNANADVIKRAVGWFNRVESASVVETAGDDRARPSNTP